MIRFAALIIAMASPAMADPPETRAVQASPHGAGWRFDVTIAHPDTGWDHYADGWRIETPEGEILATRVLHHPHETEQPFTRALLSVTVPDGMTTVHVRAKCSVDGWSSQTTSVSLVD